MFHIDPREVEQWSELPESRSKLPRVVRSLIRATIGLEARVSFPSGSSADLAGWDGQVEADRGVAFVPSGSSGWELSCNREPERKATEDYRSRTSDPKGVKPRETTYVAVSARVWVGKDEWAEERRAEHTWKDVGAYDATDLAQWINDAPGVGARFAREIGKLPMSGVQSLEAFWEEWSHATAPALAREVVLAGRDKEIERLGVWATSAPRSLYVQAETRDEAIAFVAAAALSRQETWGDAVLAQSVIISSEEAWQSLSRYRTPLTLITDLDQAFAPSIALGLGHHVLTPVGSWEEIRGDGCSLPRLPREALLAALQGMGLTEIDANCLMRRTARNLPVLRRQLIAHAGGPLPGWAESELGRALIPALVMGQWNERHEADKQALSEIAGRTYNELEAQYVDLAQQPDAPLGKIGHRWRVTSHSEAWELLGRLLTQDDLERFRRTALAVLATPSPEFDLPANERFAAAVHGKVLPHSDVLREGMCRTLALMGSRPDVVIAGLRLESLVHSIVHSILQEGNDWRLWATLGGILPTLAEAAPDAMLDAIETALNQDPPPFLELFRQEGDGCFGGCPHAGLLWALERLAWSHDHFSRAANVLAGLAAIDPGGKYSNRPNRSLRHMFLSWLRSSEVSDEYRLATLDGILEAHPGSGWKLLIDSCPQSHDVANITEPPEWRAWGQDTKRNPPRSEVFLFARAIVERALRHAGNDPSRWSDLVAALPNFEPHHRHEAQERLIAVTMEMRGKAGSLGLWHAIRRLLNHHRSYPEAEWAMSGDELTSLARAYDELRPDDSVDAIAWLFASGWPELLEGERRDYDAYRRQIADVRRRELAAFIAGQGIGGVPRLVAAVDAPWEIGSTLPDVLTGSELEAFIAAHLVGPNDTKLQACAQAACGRLHVSQGWGAAERVLGMVRQAAAPQGVVALYHSIEPSMETWRRVAAEGPEVDRAYWEGFTAIYHVGRLSAEEIRFTLERLLDAGRPLLAIKLLAHCKDHAEASLIVRALEAAPAALQELVVAGGRPELDRWDVSELFEMLDKAPDVAAEVVARLEIPFVGVLEDCRRDLALHRQVVEDPTLFADLVAWAYKRADGRTDEAIEDAERERRAELAWKILFHLRRVPGQADGGGLDAELLRTWVDKARRLSAERGRRSVADEIIGQILANAPAGVDGAWPHEEVRDILEQSRSRHMGQGFEIGKFNLRGMTTRSPLEGGGQEQSLAERYRRDSDAISARWPFTAARLRSLADSYESDGRSVDDDAAWTDQAE